MDLEPLTPERRRAMTRRYLLEAAAMVFARQGFHGATLDEVAATAGFTKGAVYSNFKNKDDLFLALLDDRIEKQVAITKEVVEGSPDETADLMSRIRDLVHAGTFWDENWKLLYLEFVLYSRRNPEAAEKLAARLQRERDLVQSLIEGQHAAEGAAPKYPTRELAEVSMALMNGLGFSRLIDPSAVTSVTVDVMLSVLHDGIEVG